MKKQDGRANNGGHSTKGKAGRPKTVNRVQRSIQLDCDIDEWIMEQGLTPTEAVNQYLRLAMEG